MYHRILSTSANTASAASHSPLLRRTLATPLPLARPVLAHPHRAFHASKPAMVVKAITSAEEFDKVIGTDRPVVIDFWATWCGPCKMISPVFEKMSEGKASEDIDFYKVDVDELEAVAQKANVRAMPTFAVFKNGKMLESKAGAVPALLQELIGKYAKAA